MIKGYKVLLLPTKEQEKLLWKHVNVSRFIYNMYKDIRDTHYSLYKDTKFKNITNGEIRKYITEL
ncbi:MAG: helix-turn-helix domain-containing protein, partial [Romboutsia sp.]